MNTDAEYEWTNAQKKWQKRLDKFQDKLEELVDEALDNGLDAPVIWQELQNEMHYLERRIFSRKHYGTKNIEDLKE